MRVVLCAGESQSLAELQPPGYVRLANTAMTWQRPPTQVTLVTRVRFFERLQSEMGAA